MFKSLLPASLQKVSLAAFLLLPSLVACETAPQMMNPALQPRAVRGLSVSPEMQTQYWLGTLLASTYNPDVNGQQFGFDYVSLTFRSGNEPHQQRLTVAYSQHNSYVRIDLEGHVGEPDADQFREAISSSDTQRLHDLNFFLSTLSTSSKADRDNLERVLVEFGKLLGQAPTPLLPGGGQSR